jgi:uroporphyrin-III C-methyltransferase
MKIITENSRPKGTLWLAGAGPGDPDLLTVKVANLIASCEVVAHDKLVSPEILALIPESSIKICVGRRKGEESSDLVLSEAVLEHIHQGRSVLRLKCGDPAVFGRLNEEVALARVLGVPWVIVPGITAASAAAADLDIGLTERGFASDLSLATGHRSEGENQNQVDWESLPKRGTIVLYMCARNLKENIKRLLESGRDASTPCALVEEASTPRKNIHRGNLKSFFEKPPKIGEKHAAVLVIGEVLR